MNFAKLVKNELMESMSKKIPVFLFLSDLLLVIVKILKAYK